MMPWTFAAKKSIGNYLNTANFKDKIEVVYPAIHNPPKFKKPKNDKIKILFVGHAFLAKGGLDLIESFKFLDKKYDLEVNMVTKLPEKYEKLKKIPNLNIYPLMPNEEVIEMFKNSDIFCFPSFVDSFGIVLLEAKAYGAAPVTTNYFAMPELVEDKKTGLSIKLPEKIENYPFTKNPRKDIPMYFDYIGKGKHPESVSQLNKVLRLLIEDNSLRKKFVLAGKKEIESGKFSINERNKKLEKIYKDSLK